MRRTLVVVGIVAATAATFGPDLGACGDKSLSAGGIRIQRAQAAKYPASVLIYVQPKSRMAAAARELKLQDVLRAYGHTYREVSSSSDFDAALGSGQFNVVMADFASLTDIQRRVEASTSRPATIGVAYRLTKAEAKEAAKQYRFLINAPTREAQYLSTITEAVRSKGSVSRKG
jgi:hypothetical protein